MIERQRRGLTKTDYGEEEEAPAARPEESEVVALNKPHYLQEQLAKLDLDSGRLGELLQWSQEAPFGVSSQHLSVTPPPPLCVTL